MKTSIQKLAGTGYLYVSYPPELRAAVEEAVLAWESFCALPSEIKRALPYSSDADGVGYERKNGIGPGADLKENFDITTAGLGWLEDHLPESTNPIIADFLRKSVRVSELIKPIALEFARLVEAEYGVEGLRGEVQNGEGSFFTRFIHYFGDREVGDEIATSHTDQSGFTLHLFESNPGFEILDHNKKWQEMNFTSGEALVIPSMQLQLRSQGALTATCHRVVATKQTAKRGRYSAVCFVQLAGTPKYDKARHGRLQEKEPGFNYGMSKEEFLDLFQR